MFEKVLKFFGLVSHSKYTKDIRTTKQVALNEGIQSANDELATQLFKRGGFSTLQLNPRPGNLPRVRFIDVKDAVPIERDQAVKFGFFELDKHNN